MKPLTRNFENEKPINELSLINNNVKPFFIRKLAAEFLSIRFFLVILIIFAAHVIFVRLFY